MPPACQVLPSAHSCWPVGVGSCCNVVTQLCMGGLRYLVPEVEAIVTLFPHAPTIHMTFLSLTYRMGMPFTV